MCPCDPETNWPRVQRDLRNPRELRDQRDRKTKFTRKKHNLTLLTCDPEAKFTQTIQGDPVIQKQNLPTL